MPGVLREILAPFGGMTAQVRDKYIDDPAGIVFRPAERLIAPAPWHNGRTAETQHVLEEMVQPI